MSEPRGPLRVARVRSVWKRADGTKGAHESVLLRQSWRDGATVKHHTVASLTHLPAEQVASLEAVLNHGAVACGVTGTGLGPGLRHGDVAAVWAMASRLGFEGMLGEPGRMRDIAMALIVARVCHPASKAAQALWWKDTTLGVDLGLADVTTDEVYAAMDWLTGRQCEIENALAARYLSDRGVNPNMLVMYDLSSTWVEGSHCELAAYGYSRDKKRGKAQIEFALVTNPDGVPVAVRVFPGNTADPTSFTAAIQAVTEQFAMGRAVMVGDRGMVTGAKISAMREIEGVEWIGALKHAQIAALASDDGPLQLTLFDQEGLAVIDHPDYPGERLIACRNPFAAAHRADKRERLIKATLQDLDKVSDRVAKGALRAAKSIGLAVGRVIDKHHVAKLVTVDIQTGRMAHGRNHAAVAAEAALDGIYVLRTSLTEQDMATSDVLGSYKHLSRIEQDFRAIKCAESIQVRPIWHHRADRVKAHLLICVLACHLSCHLRRAWAPLTFADTEPAGPTSPVRPARRSEQGDTKASTRRNAEDRPVRSFTELLAHLATMTRNTVTIHTQAGQIAYEKITDPTQDQATAFKLIGVPIPATLTR
ncbi:MAG: IS1634 family transposase [Bifidobacteriaceae bacterium]|nr:IS1634 family transposase [Bifidobacteriaceae bacterium]